MFHEIEFITSKGISELNEDNYLLEKSIFAVFDGATSLNNYKNKENLTGGYIAAEIAKSIFKNSNFDLFDYL